MLLIQSGQNCKSGIVTYESATGFYDRLDTALWNAAVMGWQPIERVCWNLDIELGSGVFSASSEALEKVG
jgi:hypothetical protein